MNEERRRRLAECGWRVGTVEEFLGLADDEALAEVRDKVQEFAPADAEDLEAIIELGKLEADGT